jgi:hypothetical protein
MPYLAEPHHTLKSILAAVTRLLSGRAYRLPTGLKLIARQTPQRNRFDLLTVNNLMWNPREGAYKAEPNGSISYQGNPTVWTVGDLIDTGEDVPQLAAGA